MAAKKLTKKEQKKIDEITHTARLRSHKKLQEDIASGKTSWEKINEETRKWVEEQSGVDKEEVDAKEEGKLARLFKKGLPKKGEGKMKQGQNIGNKKFQQEAFLKQGRGAMKATLRYYREGEYETVVICTDPKQVDEDFQGAILVDEISLDGDFSQWPTNRVLIEEQ